jgi:surfactin synthase thioesterase subunit
MISARTKMSKWLGSIDVPPHRIPLFCFPYAVGGASAYRTWQRDFPSEIQICPIQLPGRETRMRERCIDTMKPLVEQIADELEPCFQGTFNFFGYSMGGTIAFELCLELRRRKLQLPSHLFLSSCRAPHRPRCLETIHHLPRERFLNELRKYQGTSERFFQDQDLQELFLPILRADFKLMETYTYQEEPPLPIPISVFRGDQDDMVSHEEQEAWKIHTSERFAYACFPGDHFYIKQSSRSKLFQTLIKEMAV